MLCKAETGGCGQATQALEGDEVWIAKQLTDDEAPPGAQDAPNLRQGGCFIGDLAENRGQDNGVDRGCFEGQGAGIAAAGDQFVRPRLLARAIV